MEIKLLPFQPSDQSLDPWKYEKQTLHAAWCESMKYSCPKILGLILIKPVEASVSNTVTMAHVDV